MTDHTDSAERLVHTAHGRVRAHVDDVDNWCDAVAYMMRLRALGRELARRRLVAERLRAGL